MIQKFETSLGPFGPYQEIHEHVSSLHPYWSLYGGHGPKWKFLTFLSV